MPSRPAKRQRKPLPKPPQAILTEAQRAGLMPLDYMLAVVRDPDADAGRRDRMAIAAAQYCHPRAADYRKGKKDHEAETAEKAGVGTPWDSDLEYSDGRLRQ
jgi:phage terminase small subunit